MAAALKRPDAIQQILAQACARNELVILVTAYLRFESFFVALEAGELQVAATMSREDATFSLRGAELKIRFPMGLGFMEAPVRLLGLGLHQGRRTLRLSIPKQMEENDHRTEYRVDRVGRVVVTYGTPRGELLQAALVDLNTRGARIHAQMDLAGTSLQVGSVLVLSIPLSEDLQIEARGEIRHMGPRSIGLEFTPKLPEAVEEPLSRWVFQRREEDQERLALKRERNLMGERKPGNAAGPSGILLVSGDAELEEALREVLRPVQPLVRIPLSVQAMKDALAATPPLAIFHVNGGSLDERRRLKALVELAGGKVPVLLLGTQLEGAALFELAGDWKAASAMIWNPARSAFLQRLAQGIIRRHRQGGDGPLAPPEP
ncbi:MAG: PilZ domain-containing protein [Holophaga sp.]|nr:PilZ domain-containing protein [Holophaga sp.]